MTGWEVSCQPALGTAPSHGSASQPFYPSAPPFPVWIQVLYLPAASEAGLIHPYRRSNELHLPSSSCSLTDASSLGNDVTALRLSLSSVSLLRLFLILSVFLTLLLFCSCSSPPGVQPYHPHFRLFRAPAASLAQPQVPPVSSSVLVEPSIFRPAGSALGLQLPESSHLFSLASSPPSDTRQALCAMTTSQRSAQDLV